jgi:Mg-chelatase subunit ChlD
MNAGGGTAMRPVFSKTYELLEKRDKRVKHICMIFLTDGQPKE